MSNSSAHQICLSRSCASDWTRISSTGCALFVSLDATSIAEARRQCLHYAASKCRGGANVPNPRALILRRGNGAQPIIVESCAVNPIFMPAQHSDFASSPNIPNARRIVPRRGHQALAVVAETNRGNNFVMAAQHLQFPSRTNVPDACLL